MKKQVKTILLPQTGVKDYTLGNILKSDYRIRVSDGGLPDDDAWEEPCHLYIVDESSPIKENDWITDFVTVFKCDYVDGYTVLNQKELNWRKIIATTNPELIADGVPAISQEFVREYVQVQGQGVVYIEIVEKWTVTHCITDYGYIPKLDNTGKVILSIETKEAVNPLVADAIRTVPDFDKEVKSNIPEDQKAAYMLAMENIIAGKESIRNLDTMREMFLAGWNANPAKYTEQEFIEANQRHWQLGHDAATSMKGFFEGKWTDEDMYQIMKHGLIISPGYNRDSNIDEDYWRKEANQWLKQKQNND